MCVKEFIGYVCGHCSIPILVRCPIAAQSDTYPICSIPAERSKLTTDYCHPCSRVNWNKEVINNENEHKFLHENDLCDCGLVFTDKEKDNQRLQGLRVDHRAQSRKGKARVPDTGATSVLGTKNFSHRKREWVVSRKFNNEQHDGPRLGNPHYLSQPRQTIPQSIFIPVLKSSGIPVVRLPPTPGIHARKGSQQDEQPFPEIYFHAEAEIENEVGQQALGAMEYFGAPMGIESLAASVADISLSKATAYCTTSPIPMKDHLADMIQLLKTPVRISTLDYTTRQRSFTR